MDDITLFSLLAAVISLIFGLTVYSRNRLHPTNRSFFGFAVNVGFWALCMAILRAEILDPTLAGRMLYAAAALIPFTYARFVLAYEGPAEPLKPAVYVGLGLPVALVFSISLFTDYLVKNVVALLTIIDDNIDFLIVDDFF